VRTMLSTRPIPAGAGGSGIAVAVRPAGAGTRWQSRALSPPGRPA
jgi:hypothetical protein